MIFRYAGKQEKLSLALWSSAGIKNTPDVRVNPPSLRFYSSVSQFHSPCLPSNPSASVIFHSPYLCSTLPTSHSSLSAHLHSPAAHSQSALNVSLSSTLTLARLFYCIHARLFSIHYLPDLLLPTLPAFDLPSSPAR